jgi:hypothetical protein
MAETIWFGIFGIGVYLVLGACNLVLQRKRNPILNTDLFG